MLGEISVNIVKNGNFLRTKFLQMIHYVKFRTNESLRRKTKYGGKFTATMIAGDGFGPNHMNYVKEIFHCAAVPVNFEELQFDSTNTSENNMNEVLTSIRRNGAGIKGNIHRRVLDNQSRNHILRQKLDLFANVLHCKSQPGIITRHNDVDLVLIRQNTEGEYSCLEHELVSGVVESYKVVSRKKSDEIARFAFQYAVEKRRKKITTVHMVNATPLSDGLFLDACYIMAEKYPEIEFNAMKLDAICHRLVTEPQKFDVLLLTNLYGNVLNNIASGLIGGPGIMSGQNYAHDCAVFEVGTRGSVISNNPIPMINASIDLLHYLGLEAYAKIIHDSVYQTLNINRILTHDLGGTADASDVVSNIKRIIQNQTFSFKPQPVFFSNFLNK